MKGKIGSNKKEREDFKNFTPKLYMQNVSVARDYEWNIIFSIQISVHVSDL